LSGILLTAREDSGPCLPAGRQAGMTKKESLNLGINKIYRIINTLKFFKFNAVIKCIRRNLIKKIKGTP
jgi:hypothetical protein